MHYQGTMAMKKIDPPPPTCDILFPKEGTTNRGKLTWYFVELPWGQGLREGMSNWRPVSRMQPLSLFCAARIRIFIMQQFNNIADFLIFYLSLYKMPSFE